MIALQRILAATSGADGGAQVVGLAAAIARASSGVVRCVACVYDSHLAGERFQDSPELEQSRAALIDARRAALAALTRPLLGQGRDANVAARWAYPVFEGIVAEAREFEADLLVTESSRAAAGAPAALTHTDWQVIRHSPCPVLLARSGATVGYRDILVAVDPMHSHDKPAALDDALIGTAVALSGAFGARLRLLHCYLPAEYLPLRAPGALSAAAYHRRASSVQAHRDALQRLARRHGIPEDAALLEPADAREAIPEFATRLGADLVVMGAVARSRIRRLLIGSTTEPVFDRLGCDILAVKPPAA